MKRSPSSTFAPVGEAVRTQYGAICWRSAETGIDVLLISSRETGRWIIPKGWPIKGISAAAAAAHEAWEEAGVEGKLCETCLGVFSYDKIMPEDQSIPCAVSTFGLRVEKLSRRYPEQRQRRRKWFAASEAAGLVAEPGLKRLLLALDQAAQNPTKPLIKKLKPPVVGDTPQLDG